MLEEITTTARAGEVRQPYAFELSATKACAEPQVRALATDGQGVWGKKVVVVYIKLQRVVKGRLAVLQVLRSSAASVGIKAWEGNRGLLLRCYKTVTS